MTLVYLTSASAICRQTLSSLPSLGTEGLVYPGQIPKTSHRVKAPSNRLGLALILEYTEVFFDKTKKNSVCLLYIFGMSRPLSLLVSQTKFIFLFEFFPSHRTWHKLPKQIYSWASVKALWVSSHTRSNTNRIYRSWERACKGVRWVSGGRLVLRQYFNEHKVLRLHCWSENCSNEARNKNRSFGNQIIINLVWWF